MQHTGAVLGGGGDGGREQGSDGEDAFRIGATAYGGPPIVAHSILPMTRLAIKDWRGLAIAAAAAAGFFAGASVPLVLAAFIAMLLYVLAAVAKSAFIGPWDVGPAAAAMVALRARVSAIWVVLAAAALALVLVR